MKLYEEFKECETMWEPLEEANYRAGKPSPEEYFNSITSSIEALKAFINEKLAPYVKNSKTFDTASRYESIVARETSSGNNVDIHRNTSVNYKAFISEIAALYGITRKDLLSFIRTGNLNITGTPLPANSIKNKSAGKESSTDDLYNWLEAEEVPQETKELFHKQNVRILKLLAKYTDIYSSHKVDLDDLLKQLDEAGTRYQSARAQEKCLHTDGPE